MSYVEKVLLYDANGQPWIQDGNGGMPVNIVGVTPNEANGAMPVNIQDQTTPTIILPMVREIGANTLSIDAVLNAYTVTVTSAAGMTIGNHFRIINAAADRYYFGRILNIVGAVITLDTQIDFAYVAGSEVTYSSTNMNVDGSVTPVKFTLRTGAPSIPSPLHITRMIITAMCASAVDFGKFGNITALTRGFVFRTVNGDVHNIFNVKTNADIAAITYDFTNYFASNPGTGVDGFVARLTFAGMSKLGVALRVAADGNLEVLVQDNLTALTSLRVILEGHVVI